MSDQPTPGEDLNGEKRARALSELAALDGETMDMPSKQPEPEPVAWSFGAGRLVVDTGTYHGQPAVFICPVASPGPVGENSAHLGHDRYSLQPGEQVLTFPSAAQAVRVADALVNTQPSKQTGGGGEGEEALRRLRVMRDQARNGTAVTDPNEWEADELDAILAALSTNEVG